MPLAHILLRPTLLSPTRILMSLMFQAGTHKWEIREVSSGDLLSSSDVILSEGGEAEPDLEEKTAIR